MTSQAVGLGAAVDYLTAIGMDAIAEHELELTAAALDGLALELPGVRIIGPQRHRSTAAGRWRSSSTACTRTTSGRCSTTGASRCGSGHHCAWPLHRGFGDRRHRAGVVPRVQRRRTRSTRWWTACGRPASSSGSR